MLTGSRVECSICRLPFSLNYPEGRTKKCSSEDGRVGEATQVELGTYEARS